jgi:small conductance mechanosensitive channel
MSGINTDSLWHLLSTQGADFGLKVLAALAAWIVGRWLIALGLKLFSSALKRGAKVDATLAHYLRAILRVALNIGLVLAILDIFGVKTTSFAALLAGAGLAVGTAWGGMLTHFAAGVFMQLQRPFKVGDYVTAGSVTGWVREIGLFNTTLVTLENVRTIVGNNAIVNGVIQNYSALPYRRVDTAVRLANGVDPLEAIARLRGPIAAIANVVAEPVPEIEILAITLEGPQLTVRPYCHNDHYWQVYFDTYKTIVATFAAAGYPLPETPIAPRERFAPYGLGLRS